MTHKKQVSLPFKKVMTSMAAAKPPAGFRKSRWQTIIGRYKPEKIRSVQLGKSVLIVCIEFLLKVTGFDKSGKIIIAGIFGSQLDKLDLIKLGIIPEIAPDKIETSENSAGAGAIMPLCSDY